MDEIGRVRPKTDIENRDVATIYKIAESMEWFATYSRHIRWIVRLYVAFADQIRRSLCFFPWSTSMAIQRHNEPIFDCTIDF